MKILRTIIWVLAGIGFLIFAIYNWKPVEVTLWQDVIWETRLPAFALLAFLLGFLPLWAYHLSAKFALNRRIKALENSLKSTALARHHEPAPTSSPVGTPVEKPVSRTAEPDDPLSPTEGGEK